MYFIHKKVTLFAVAIAFVGCSNHQPKVVFPDKGYENMEWSASAKAQNIAVFHLTQDAYSSTHLIRIKGSEKPHYHDQHDLTVTILEGESIIHFRDHEVILYQGDVIHIPKGTYHWAENIDSKASVVFATFSPAFRGKDKRLAD